MNALSERARSDDGYRLWLRYEALSDEALARSYADLCERIHFPTPTATLRAAYDELEHALDGLLPAAVRSFGESTGASFVVGTPESCPAVADLREKLTLDSLGPEGYTLRRGVLDQSGWVLAARSDVGVLYGVFSLLRALQTHTPLASLERTERPAVGFRMLNHWDNLDRTIERGYAGFSLWDWHKLPHYVAPRYTDYARLNASVGINAVSLTNVNANALVLTERYLAKVKALADVFRPYGIRVFLTARFSAPTELDGLPSSDPLAPSVIRWWHAKVSEIYRFIPDFGGFVVKANSEGQPGPQDFGRSQADGANFLASALEPHGGIVVWRAFVYDDKVPDDRHKQAFNELAPLDGQFLPNAALQVKNGPIDFQPREPFHPLFGAMPKTPLFLEFQLTQEYLGLATHLVYLGPLFRETLDSDTHANGSNSTVTRIITGELSGHTLSGMAGVSNIGDERNWCGHPFAAANWYAFARLAWNPSLASAALAEEWLRMTFNNDDDFVAEASELMERSREAAVEYMTPLGLHHLMAESHHYGPGPWVTGLARDDWTATYYHRADEAGLGFDRTSSGSNALSQYAPAVRALYANPNDCPERFLLWFHHVDWDHRMRSGRTLWDELCHVYTRGVESTRQMQRDWSELSWAVDPGRFSHVSDLLAIQVREAEWWRNACLSYFQTFSQRPLPSDIEPLHGSLDAYMKHRDLYVPGI